MIFAEFIYSRISRPSFFMQTIAAKGRLGVFYKGSLRTGAKACLNIRGASLRGLQGRGRPAACRNNQGAPCKKNHQL